MQRLARISSWRASGWVAVAIAGRYTVGAWNLRRTLDWVDRPDAAVPDLDAETDIAVHFVVPVLREQQHVPAALAWFAPLVQRLPGSTLTIVTTAREEQEREHLVHRLIAAGFSAITEGQFPQLAKADIIELNTIKSSAPDGVLTRARVAEILARSPLTSQVVEHELARPEYQGLSVHHLHYPGSGRKAAQVNYAVAHLAQTADHNYIAVYDVDSRPSAELLHHTMAFLGERRLAEGEFPAVVQQSARFATHGTSPRGWERMVCRGAARSQTLWTLRREIPSFRRYAWATRHRTGIPVWDAMAQGMAQTVGHGLLVRLDVFRRVGGLPTYSVLDDYPFGYRLTIDSVGVECLPFTTVVPAPENVRELLAQGRRWFQNYLDYPRCAAAARAAGHGTATTRAVALGVGCYRGATWLLRSPSVVACAGFVAGCWSWPVRVVAAAGLCLDMVVSVRMLAIAEGRSPSIRHRSQECLELLVASLLSSAGPFLAVAHRIISGAPEAALALKTEYRGVPDSTAAVAAP